MPTNYQRVPTTTSGGDGSGTTAAPSPNTAATDGVAVVSTPPTPTTSGNDGATTGLQQRSNSVGSNASSAASNASRSGGQQQAGSPTPPTTAASQQQQQQQQSQSQYPRRSLSDRLQDKIAAFLWVLLAAGVAYGTDFWNVVLLKTNSDSAKQPSRPILQVAALAISVDVALVLYLVVYLPRCKGLVDSSAWRVYCPRVVPIAIAVAVVAALLLIRGTWPVWGFFAPFVLGMQAMGALFALHFVPWFCGSSSNSGSNR